MRIGDPRGAGPHRPGESRRDPVAKAVSGGESMRNLLVALTVVALLAAGGVATAGSNTGKCRKLTRQIEQFEGTLALAKQRDDDLWADATKAHIARLGERRANLCPEYRPRNKAAEFVKTVRTWTRTAAKAAYRYFTGQWF